MAVSPKALIKCTIVGLSVSISGKGDCHAKSNGQARVCHTAGRRCLAADGCQRAPATLEDIRRDIQATERALLACLEQGGADVSSKGALRSAAAQLVALLQQAARDLDLDVCTSPTGAVQGACVSPGQVPSALTKEGSPVSPARPAPAAAALQGQLRQCQAVLAGALGQEPVQELACVLQGLYARRAQLHAGARTQQGPACQAHAGVSAAGAQAAGACPARQQGQACSRPGSSVRVTKDGGVAESSAVHAAKLDAQRLRGLLAEVRCSLLVTAEQWCHEHDESALQVCMSCGATTLLVKSNSS